VIGVCLFVWMHAVKLFSNRYSYSFSENFAHDRCAIMQKKHLHNFDFKIFGKFLNFQIWTLSLKQQQQSCLTQQAAVVMLTFSCRVSSLSNLETGPLPPQDYKSGTVCRPISDYVGCHTASSGGYWRNFYSDSEAMAQCELFLTAPNRSILSYLLCHQD